jgi:hypothetical protein
MTARFSRAAVALAALVVAGPALADMKAANAAYGNLLTKYVTPRGVRYASWRTNGDDLKLISEVVMIYRSADVQALDPADRKALIINLYNAKILETVLLQNPSGTIRALSKPLHPNEIFTRKAMVFSAKPFSLDDLETRLRKEFKDPRTHFALNCAARSCPPLRPEPYAGARLDDQLDDTVRTFLASPAGLTMTTSHGVATLDASRILDWYAEEFKPGGGVLPFLAKYAPPDAAAAAAAKSTKLRFQDYDWGLNTAP